MKKKLLLLLTFLMFGCKNDLEKKVEYYPNGKVYREYFVNSKNEYEGEFTQFNEDGTYFKKGYIKNDKFIDSVIFFEENKISCIEYKKDSDTVFLKYFDNEKIHSSGYELNNIKIGKWSFYKDNKISNVIQYIDLCGTEYLNQGWFYDNNGDLDLKKSHFIEILDLKKTYKINEPIKFKMKYNSLWKNNSFSIAEFHTKVDNNFCNLKKIKKDALLSKEHVFVFSISFAEKGKKNIRGVIGEVLEKNDNKVRELFFDIPIEIN